MDGALLRRLIRKNKSDVVHTSGFASVQSGGAVGAASVESFQKRREVDKNRTIVKGYGKSRIVLERQRNLPRIGTVKSSESVDRGTRSTPISEAQRVRADREARFNAGVGGQNKSASPVIRKNPGFYG